MADEQEAPTITIDDWVKRIECIIRDNYKIPGLQASELKKISPLDPTTATVSYALNFYHEIEMSLEGSVVVEKVIQKVMNFYTIEIINPDKKGGETIRVKFMRGTNSSNGNLQNLNAGAQITECSNGVYRIMKAIKGDTIDRPVNMFGDRDYTGNRYELEFTVLEYEAYLLESQPGINPESSKHGNARDGSHADAAPKIPQGHSIDEILAELKRIYGLQDMQKDTKNNMGYSYEIEPVHGSFGEITQKALLTIKLEDKAVETYLILCDNVDIGVVWERKKIDKDLPLDKENDLLFRTYSAARYLETISGNRCRDKSTEIIERKPRDRAWINSKISTSLIYTGISKLTTPSVANIVDPSSFIDHVANTLIEIYSLDAHVQNQTGITYDNKQNHTDDTLEREITIRFNRNDFITYYLRFVNNKLEVTVACYDNQNRQEDENREELPLSLQIQLLDASLEADRYLRGINNSVTSNDMEDARHPASKLGSRISYHTYYLNPVRQKLIRGQDSIKGQDPK